MTLSAMTLKTSYMQEQMRRDAIMDTMEKYEKALVTYYTQGHDNGETTALYKELERMGVDIEVLVDVDLEIRDRVANEEDMQRLMKVQLNGLYGDDQYVAWFRQQGTCAFDFVSKKDFATAMPKYKCIEVLAYQNYYCKIFNAKNMKIVEA